MNSDRIRQWFPLPFVMLALLLPAGCQTGGSGGSSGKAPQAAIDACLHSADSYRNVAPGTATYFGVATADVAVGNPAAAGDNWALQVTVAGVAMLCNVTPGGTVQNIQPL